MKTIGLTGGIGAGKSYVAQIFQALSVPVYNSDERAKELYHKPEIKNQVIELLGNEAYLNNALNKVFIAQKVFQSQELLKALNQIIHPAVGKDFKSWQSGLKAKYCIKEAAILFESGSYKTCDQVINVLASPNIRIERVMKRSNMSKAEVQARMKKQWSEQERTKHADYLVFNNAEDKLLEQVLSIHESILRSTTV